MRKVLLVCAVLLAVSAGCESKPPVGPGKVTITETTTSTSTTTTTTSTEIIPTKADFRFSPQTPEVLQVVEFNASISIQGSDRRIVSYEWDFGDGVKKTGITSTHDFTPSGVYLVTLKVTNNLGETDEESKPVTVRPIIP
jgi:PKD repeat protein